MNGNPRMDDACSRKIAARLLSTAGMVMTACFAHCGPAPTASAPDLGPAVFAVAGTITDFRSQSPLAGASVCLYFPQMIPCVQSGADGKYTLSGIPQDTDVILSFEKADYLTDLLIGNTQTVQSTSAPLDADMIATFDAGLLAGLVNKSLDPDKGLLALVAFGPDGTKHLDGVTYSLTPSIGDGPYYFTDTGVPAMTNVQTMTGANGTAALINVPPGDYEATATHGTLSCTRSLTWAGTKPNGGRVRVAAGALATGTFRCK